MALMAATLDEADPAFLGAVHATSVVCSGKAILIRGDSGVGKSDLALRLIDRGATLLCDDYTHLIHSENALIAEAVDTIAGMIEVRGLGLIRLPHIEQAPVSLIVMLLNADGPQPVRIPASLPVQRLCGVDVPVLALHGFEVSAPLKIELALKCLHGQINFVKAQQ